ncbi:hypothetical protein BK659_25955 [Pseudomonas brassicacearum]|uniref:Uncharacterized protein n=1 Tax=Pseudomonas brassicacearum TaxID=930166 RepID=A0A423GWH0_9PSED|nr:hypothetical protein BK659_25955 [Pseudomonas brassicacearum]
MLAITYTGIADTFYFRCTDDQYTLYVRSEGEHFGKVIDLQGIVFTGSSTQSHVNFNMLDINGKTITLNDINGDTQVIQLSTQGKILRSEFGWADFPVRFELGGQVALKLTLNILERNTPYLSHPDEV